MIGISEINEIKKNTRFNKKVLITKHWMTKKIFRFNIAFVFLISSASYCKGKEIVRFQHAKLIVLSLRKFFFYRKRSISSFNCF